MMDYSDIEYPYQPMIVKENTMYDYMQLYDYEYILRELSLFYVEKTDS